MPDFTGGTEYEPDGIYRYHLFTSSGTFTMVEGGDCEVIAVGGGGAGHNGSNSLRGGGGGGAGEYVYTTVTINATQTITIGAGGLAQNNPGNDTTVGALVTAKAGGGGGISGTLGNPSPVPGGSGGGSSTVGDQSNGGPYNGENRAGGGGGAGGNGTQPHGGPGIAVPAGFSDYIGVSGFIAGGGGGGYRYTNGGAGVGGSGGGGDANVSGNPEDGVANTGSGGGGGGRSFDPIAGDGGSGVVIIRYELPTNRIGANLVGTLTVTPNLEIIPPTTYLMGNTIVGELNVNPAIDSSGSYNPVPERYIAWLHNLKNERIRSID